MRKAVVEGCPAGAADLADYLADSAVGVLQDEGSAADSFREGLETSLSPFLEEYSVPAVEVSSFFDLLVRAAFKDARDVSVSAGGNGATAPCQGVPADNGDVLCRLPDLLMMYGGSNQPLLRNATLELVKGHRYGVVGANGTGKTTLMSRIAAGDILGFPKDIRVVHLSHDKINQGVTEQTSVTDYSKLRGAADDFDTSHRCLKDVGFDEEMLGKTVDTLSGGWQMRLALACAMAQKSNLLLLDEPTNHLDTAAVSWLVSFIKRACVGGAAGATAVIVSHDQPFLDQVCTDVVHFTPEGGLNYHPGNFGQFKATVLKGDQAKADTLLEIRTEQSIGAHAGPSMVFPTPERIGATTAARKAPVLTLQNVSFKYDGTQGAVLRDISVKVAMDSRIGITGKNGAGKSTLLSLLAGRERPNAVGGGMPGERWCNKYVRLAYIAQTHLVHLSDHLQRTPVEYIQARYMSGYDVEAPQRDARPLTEKEEADRKRLGIQFGKKSKPIKALLGRREQVRHAAGSAGAREYQYKVQWEGVADSEASWEGKAKILKCGCEGMLQDLDDRLADAWAGVDERPLSTEEVVQHLETFGLPEEVVTSRRVSMLSSGQKIKLMFGAALWTRAHLLLLDEPTNYLDPQSLEMLAEALKSFKGAYAIVTHNETFVEQVCNEVWTVADGQISGAKRLWGKTKGK